MVKLLQKPYGKNIEEKPICIFIYAIKTPLKPSGKNIRRK
jgi:hypothetical protein